MINSESGSLQGNCLSCWTNSCNSSRDKQHFASPCRRVRVRTLLLISCWATTAHFSAVSTASRKDATSSVSGKRWFCASVSSSFNLCNSKGRRKACTAFQKNSFYDILPTRSSPCLFNDSRSFEVQLLNVSTFS